MTLEVSAPFSRKKHLLDQIRTSTDAGRATPDVGPVPPVLMCERQHALRPAVAGTPSRVVVTGRLACVDQLPVGLLLRLIHPS